MIDFVSTGCAYRALRVACNSTWDGLLCSYDTTNVLMHSESTVLIQCCHGLMGTANPTLCVHQSQHAEEQRSQCVGMQRAVQRRGGAGRGRTAVLNVNVNHSKQKFFIRLSWLFLAEQLHSHKSRSLFVPGGFLHTQDNCARNPPSLLLHTICLHFTLYSNDSGKEQRGFLFKVFSFSI